MLASFFKNNRDALIVFTVIFLIYIYFMPPVLAPYRDAGEFAFDIYTSSVSHQPGYPLYNIIGKIFTFIIPGNFAFRLNLFSAIMGALSVVMIFKILKDLFNDSSLIKYFLSLLFGINFTMLTVSSVSEMYSMHVFFATLLIYLFLKFFIKTDKIEEKKILLFVYLCGLFLTNRMDILLIYPSFLVIFLYRKEFKPDWKLILKSIFFFSLGFSVYFYLYFLSKSDPLINWSDPSSLKNLINIITRKSYGSTLDLISLKYKKGENFIPNIVEYVKHLGINLNILLLFIIPGIYNLYRKKSKLLYFFLTIFVLTGPFFLYIANMPPNPHSLSIVEPYYLIPDIAILFIIFFGLKFIKKRLILNILLSVSFLSTFIYNFPYYNRSNLRVTENYAKDVLLNLPENSIIVAKKDVQIFSLWYYRYVENIRKDVDVVAQGLSGAMWYHKSKINRKITVLHLKNKENWTLMKEINGRRLFATIDCEIPSDLKTKPYGLFEEILPSDNSVNLNILSKLNYKSFKKPYNDFFVYDLATAYSQAITNVVSKNLEDISKHSIILSYLDTAEKLDNLNKNIYFYRGIIYSKNNNWEKALESFINAKDVLFSLKDKARKYKSFKSVLEMLDLDISYAYLNIGVCYEKLKKPEDSRNAYFKALKFNPSSYQAYYNLAVLYWKTDKEKAKKYLLNVLKIKPDFQEARYYLSILK